MVYLRLPGCRAGPWALSARLRGLPHLPAEAVAPVRRSTMRHARSVAWLGGGGHMRSVAWLGGGGGLPQLPLLLVLLQPERLCRCACAREQCGHHHRKGVGAAGGLWPRSLARTRTQRTGPPAAAAAACVEGAHGGGGGGAAAAVAPAATGPDAMGGIKRGGGWAEEGACWRGRGCAPAAGAAVSTGNGGHASALSPSSRRAHSSLFVQGNSSTTA
eukprot:1157116-Pelagomonas_calceolata.AAC.6